jgi:hypothetical protein
MNDARPARELPLYRLYLLRGMFLLIGLGQGSQTWPAIIHRTKPWDLWHAGRSLEGGIARTAPPVYLMLDAERPSACRADRDRASCAARYARHATPTTDVRRGNE